MWYDIILFLIDRTFSVDMDDRYRRCFNKETIKRCDDHKEWSEPTMENYKNEKYRYCEVKSDPNDSGSNSCILEEIRN